MKYFAVFILALILGYLIYPVINPIQETVIHRTEKTTTVNPIETRAHIIENVPSKPEVKDPPATVDITIQPEKNTKTNVLKIERELNLEKMTMAERIMANKISLKIYHGFAQYPNIPVQDSRIVKLSGTFSGKLKSVEESRTGLRENVTFQVNQDPEKAYTKFEVMDVYDNRQFNYYQLTEHSFRSVPGDENYLLMRVPQGFIIFDIRNFPVVSGKQFQLHQMTGEFMLTKTNANQLD